MRQTRKKYVTKEKRLTKIAEKFENGEYTLDEYVDNVSKWMGIRR